MEKYYYLIDQVEVRILLLTLTSFTITYFAIPAIIRVARMKGLFDEPENRSSHSTLVPTLGGVSIFAAIIISVSLFAKERFVDFDLLNASLVILFFFGIKDDILMISPTKKLLAQIVAALIISIGSNVRIPHMFSILGFEAIPYWFSIVITVFVIVLIINSFNLIDGVDGLAASVGITSSLVFGIWFYMNSYISLALLSATLFGSLIAFLRYNFSRRNKIFMGDTGSMIVGFIISVLAIQFIQHNGIGLINGNNGILTAPVLVIAILIIPLFDTLRVFMIRILNKKSPFQPDKNHIHHRLLELGLSHGATTSVMVFANVVFILLAYHMQDTGIDKFILLVVSLAFFVSSLPFFIKTKQELIENIKDEVPVIKPEFRKEFMLKKRKTSN